MAYRYISLLFFCLLLSGCDRSTKEEFFAKGKAQGEAGNLHGAAVFYRNALEKDEKYYEARYELAKAFLSVSKVELAEKEFLKLLEQDPSRDQVRIELARVYLLIRKTDPAVAQIEAYVKRHGESTETDELLGIAGVLQNQPGRAEIHLRKALSGDPANTKIKRELATLYIQFRMQEKEQDARRLIDELIQSVPSETKAYYLLAELENNLGHKEKALSLYQKITELDPSDYKALYRIGIFRISQKNLLAAGEIMQSLQQKFPRQSEGPRLAGIINFNNKNYSDAITNLLRSMQLAPTDEAIYYLGLCYYSKGDLESALSQFYKLSDTIYGEPSRLLVGMILLNQKRLDDAIAEIRKLLANKPDHALAHNILGSALMAKGQYEEGIKSFNLAIELDPGIIDAHLKKGVFHLLEGRLQDAERDFSSAVQAAPEILNSRQILASFYLREKQPERAIAILKEGLVSEKSDAVLYDNLSSVRFFQNRRNEGLEYLLKAQSLDPDYLPATFHLATYYAVAGETEAALREYRRLLVKDPKNLTAWLSIAALFEFNDRDTEALEAYKGAKATETGPGYQALANYYLRKAQQDEAMAVLQEAIKSVPRNLDARQLTFEIYLQRKELKEAQEMASEIEILDRQIGLRRKIEAYVAMQDETRALNEAQRYISIHPDSAHGYMMQSLIYEQWQEMEHAVEAAQKGIRADRENMDAKIHLGNLYARVKDYPAAEAIFAEALRKDQNSAAVLFAQGTLLEQIGKPEAAIKKYLEVIDKNESHAAALNNLAYLYVNGLGNKNEGLRLAFLAFRQDPGNVQIMDTLGFALQKNGMSAEACKILERAHSLRPGLATVIYHLALASHDAGKKERALQLLREIKDRSDFSQAPQAQQLYDKIKKG